VTESQWTEDVLRNVTLQRRKGDALAKAGHTKDAARAYDLALSFLEGPIENIAASLSAHDPRVPVPQADIAADAAELFGLRGGLLRRLARLDDALDSYRRGAEIESANDLPSTYNRTNTIKLSLITGYQTIRQLEHRLKQLQDVLNMRLSTDERAADDAWIWADLGDVRLLLGDVTGAESAYRTFTAKARTDSPAVALSVLKEITRALEAHSDRDADRVKASLERVETLLVLRSSAGTWVGSPPAMTS